MLCTSRVLTQPSTTENAVTPDQIKHPVIFLLKGGQVRSYSIAHLNLQLYSILQNLADHQATRAFLSFPSPHAYIFVNWFFIYNLLFNSLHNLSL